MHNQPRPISFDEMHKAGKEILNFVPPHAGVLMILELAMFPFEDVLYDKLQEARELYSMSFRD